MRPVRKHRILDFMSEYAVPIAIALLQIVRIILQSLKTSVWDEQNIANVTLFVTICACMTRDFVQNQRDEYKLWLRVTSHMTAVLLATFLFAINQYHNIGATPSAHVVNMTAACITQTALPTLLAGVTFIMQAKLKNKRY